MQRYFYIVTVEIPSFPLPVHLVDSASISIALLLILHAQNYPDSLSSTFSFLNSSFASTPKAVAILKISVSLMIFLLFIIELNCCTEYPAFLATALCFRHLSLIILFTFVATIEFNFPLPFLKFL